MNFKLNSQKENNELYLIDQLAIAIDEHLAVLNYEGSSQLFFKKYVSNEAYLLKDFLQDRIYNKLHKYITQALLTGNKIISKYYFIEISKRKMSLRFVIFSDHKNLSTTIFIEAIPVEDTVISDKAFSRTSTYSNNKVEANSWETVFMHSPVSTLLLDDQGKLMRGNNAFCEVFGFTKREMADFTLTDLFVSKESFLRGDVMEQLRKGEILYYREEKLIKRKNAPPFSVIISVSLIRSNANVFIVQFQDNATVALYSNKWKESEIKYQALFSNVNDAVFLISNEQLLDFNDKAIEIFECEAKDFMGLSPFKLSPNYQPDKQLSSEKIEEKIALAMNGKSQFLGWEFQKPNGARFEAEIKLTSIMVGSETFLQVIVNDITKRKEGEKAIRESESRLKGIFEGAGIGIGVTDPYGKMIESNQALEDLLGYSKNELLGKAIIELVHPEDRDFEKRFLTFYQNTHLKPGFFEKRYIRKDGCVVWGKLTTSVIYDEKGIPAFGIGMLEDITQRKRAEEKVRENQELLNRVNENLTEGIYRSIPGKGLVYVNKAFAKMFGYDSVAEALRLSSDSLNNFYDEENRRKKLLKEIKRKGHLKNKESLFRRKDGTTFWGLENSTISITPDGGMITDGVVVDITEKKKSEELLKNKNEELKKINEELDRFVYSASHDLRAPLTSLLGLINIAQADRYINGIDEHLELMKKSVLKLDSFIIDIINYSRNARLDIEVGEVDLNALVVETIDNLQYVAMAEKIEKRVQIVQKYPLYSDSKRISILLNNLVSNAIRYHNVILSNPYIEIKGKVTKEKVRLDIIDNGKGIGKQYLNNIFAMFYRASDDSKGSGLGLYIVKETVTKLNGKISVTSEIGQGSTFSIVIPNLYPHKKKKKVLTAIAD